MNTVLLNFDRVLNIFFVDDNKMRFVCVNMDVVKFEKLVTDITDQLEICVIVAD